MRHIFFLLLSLTQVLLGNIDLDYMMTPKEQKETGIEHLTYSEKKALEIWIDDNFDLKESQARDQEELYLSLNIGKGAKLQLSDGTAYEVYPEDRMYSVSWVTPVPLKIGTSDNPNYPIKITNLQTNTSIKAKRITLKEALETKKPKPEKKIQPKQNEKT